MPKRKLTKHEDDIRRGLRSPDSMPPYGKLRKSAENSPTQSPHDGIHTCSRGCSKPGCSRALRDTIQEQDAQIEALKRDLLEATAENRKKAMDRVHDLNLIGGLQEENARLKEQMESYIEEAQTLGCFMRRFDWILYSHNCKGGTERTHKALDELRSNYLEWRNPGEKEQGL